MNKLNYNPTSLRSNLGNYIVPEDCRGGVAVDIGCNNGNFTKQYSSFFRKIHAYEPNVHLYKLLVEEFKPQEHIKIFNNAIHKNKGELLKLCSYFSVNEDGSFGISKDYMNEYWNENSLICETVSVDLETIIENMNEPISYLKVDCECGEYDGLLNKRLESIKYIGIEMHTQLGKEKYEELYRHISITHTSNNTGIFDPTHHAEVLFKNKLI